MPCIDVEQQLRQQLQTGPQQVEFSCRTSVPQGPGPASGPWSLLTPHPEALCPEGLAVHHVGGLLPFISETQETRAWLWGPWELHAQDGSSVVWPQVPDLETIEDSLSIASSPSQGLGSRESPKSMHLV